MRPAAEIVPVEALRMPRRQRLSARQLKVLQWIA
jgi:hypothetical protein